MEKLLRGPGNTVSHWLSSGGNPCPCVWGRGQAKEATDEEERKNKQGKREREEKRLWIRQNPDFSDPIVKL